MNTPKAIKPRIMESEINPIRIITTIPMINVPNPSSFYSVLYEELEEFT